MILDNMMNKLFFKAFLYGLAFFSMAGLFSCQENPETEYYKYQGQTQGTWFSVIYEAEQDYAKDIDSLLSHFNQSLNNYDSTSVISRINRNENLLTDSLFRAMFLAAETVWEASGMRFDITVAPLANVWGFGYKTGHLPDSAEIDSIMMFVGMDKVKLVEKKIIKEDERVEIIGNAIAQGMSVDYLANYLIRKNLDNFLVEIGGEVRAQGISPKGKKWLVGIDKPIVDSTLSKREMQTAIELDHLSIATSGNYRKYKEHKGKRYGHSINPVTGYPESTEIISASVLHPQCMLADAWATAFMLMDTEPALETAEKLPQTEAMFITGDTEDDYNIYYTSGFQNFIPE